MTRRLRLSPTALLASACVMVLALGGCGRKGALEAPPDPVVQAAQSANPDAKPKKAKRTPIKPPKSPSILDSLV